MTLKVLELFAGIGACSSALNRLAIEHEIMDAVEIDKYAIKSFNAIHGTNFETQDITKWNKDLEVDLIMHGSPCQDFSLAGKQAGGDIGSGTRSSLMYETIRIVGKLRPKYVIWENVKNVLSVKHKHNFDNYLTAMSSLGYTNYYQVLNAKDFGIPQNRERVFTISILNGEIFDFPPKQELKLRLKDVLDAEVDEKYYLSDEQVEKIKSSNFMQEKKRIQEKDYCDTLLARDWKDPKCVDVTPNRLFNIYGNNKGTSFAGNVWDKEQISPTLTNMQGGNRQPMIMIKNATKKGFQEAFEGDGINISSRMHMQRGNVQKGIIQTITTSGGNDRGVVVSVAMRGRYDKNGKVVQKIEISERECANAITTVQKDSMVSNGVKIRKLTPKECWRLMGFTDEEFSKAEKVNSNTQLYKQAGNSIVVNVLVEIFKNLFGR